MKFKILTLAIAALFLTSCQEEVIEPNPTPIPVPIESGTTLRLTKQSSVGLLMTTYVTYYNNVTGEYRYEYLQPQYENNITYIEIDSVDWDSSIYIKTRNGIETSQGFDYWEATFILYKDGFVIDNRVIDNQYYEFNH